jgi:hypothetical protein
MFILFWTKRTIGFSSTHLLDTQAILDPVATEDVARDAVEGGVAVVKV